MSNIVDKLVEGYIRDMLPENKGIIKEMEEFARDNNIPIVHPEVAKFLDVIIKISKVKSILEVGTAIGYSALIFSRAMGNEGKIVTIEKSEDMYNLAKNNIKKAGQKANIDILLGDGREVLPQIEGKFDMIFLDAAKGHYQKFLLSCIDRLNDNGIIVSDNVLYKGMVASNQYVVRRKITIVKRMRKYLNYISNHPRLTTSIIPIGDGVALTYKLGGNYGE
ncbi:Predicted O-methyltransferase YrrM [Maledivibacter halophilus]|uniref:tRNA 5-hydroxyuridine methyltransferase n=1 Tax=Maledivibacter halophilus TaxID=36842 RepID=A0A1T5L0Y4_9FIRM|nr:O-methyltransferase [Maledivibacter halophilus]SKC69603.1 Predicted O-methyltransferase YrrM [Maledivibacter halophilus]